MTVASLPHQALLASTFKLPEKGTGKYILVSIAEDRYHPNPTLLLTHP
jgi:hypothetical protein